MQWKRFFKEKIRLADPQGEESARRSGKPEQEAAAGPRPQGCHQPEGEAGGPALGKGVLLRVFAVVPQGEAMP